MNWLDRAILAVAPTWGANRVFARMAATRAFDIAKKARGGSSSRPASGPNAEIAGTAGRGRNAARDFYRNNPYANAMIKKRAAKLVGTGITPLLPSGDALSKTARAKLIKLWKLFVDQSDPEGRHDFYGQQLLAAKTWLTDGECLIRILRRNTEDAKLLKLVIPFQLRVMEIDYLDHQKTEQLAGGNVVIMGIEYDRLGQRVGYWLFDQHPGELGPLNKIASTLKSSRVPASEIIHLFDRERPDQVRGMTSLAPVAMKLQDVEEYDEAALVGRKAAACHVAVFETPAAVAKPFAAAPAETAEKGADGPTKRLRPATILNTTPGQKVVFNSPPQDDTYPDYMRVHLRAIANGGGVMYEHLTGDLSDLNFSSIKAGMNDFHDQLDVDQHHILAWQLCRPVYVLFLEYCLVQELVSIPASKLPVIPRWMMPRRRMADPTKEIPSNIEGLRSGQMFLPDIWAEQGEDVEERLDAMEAFNKALDQRKIVLDSDPRVEAKAAKAAAKKAAEPAATTEGKTDT